MYLQPPPPCYNIQSFEKLPLISLPKDSLAITEYVDIIPYTSSSFITTLDCASLHFFVASIGGMRSVVSLSHSHGGDCSSFATGSLLFQGSHQSFDSLFPESTIFIHLLVVTVTSTVLTLSIASGRWSKVLKNKIRG